LAVAAGLPALAWLLPAPWGAAATLTLAIGLCLTRRVVRTALLTAAPFWLFLFLLHDPARAVALGLRLSTMIASFIWLVAALPPARLVEALIAARWPATAAYLFAATLSAVPALQARARRLVDAQRCRGLATRGSVGARFRALRALALPLVLSALHEVDERALALETRGLGAGARRTPLAPPADSWAQMTLRWGLAVVCAAALWWRFT
jgi:energy-coupling factor transport system permease protein